MFHESNGWKITSLAGIDISVSFGYLFIIVLSMILNGLIGGLLFAVALTLSLIVHEMGHALVAKHFKLAPSILLHGFGGLCFHRIAQSDRDDALIVLAGPLLQILTGTLVWLLTLFVPATAHALTLLFVTISIFWGLLNLLVPIFPLDGGKLLNLILRRFTSETKARDWTLKISITLAIPVAILGIMNQVYFLGLLGFFIIMDNINALKNGTDITGRAPKAKVSDFAKDLLNRAEKSFEDKDFRESWRICHQLRASNSHLNDVMQNRVWEILALSAFEIDETEEALQWARHAPKTTEIKNLLARLEP